MMLEEIRAVFEAAVQQKCGVDIRHAGQGLFVYFQPTSVGPTGASGYMPTNSGSWPRSARFGEIVEAKLAPVLVPA